MIAHMREWQPALLTVAAAVCLILAGRRRHRSARWWLWLLAAPVLMVAGLPAMDRR